MGIPFGRYELLRRIAAGGMGEVYLARQAGLEGFEKLLVVKVLLPHLVENEEFITMFLDEARIAARLNHANVAQIFDLGEVDGAFYIAMEYIHGEDVKRIWRSSDEAGKPVPLPLAVRIAADAAAGLDYAHKATDGNNEPLGIVHRDVSPQNILVTFDGGVKIIDFGIARAANRNVHTATGTLKGKYPYMSPEQATSRNLDHRSDIFALGVVLYEMATDLRLFARDSEILIIQAVAACDVPRPSLSNPAIDEQLEGLILKALAKSPDDRFKDAQEMRLALEDWLVSTRQSGSSAHLAAFLQGLYAERLADERIQGRPLTELDYTPSSIGGRSSLGLMGSRQVATTGRGGAGIGASLPPAAGEEEPNATAVERRRPEESGIKASLFAVVAGLAALAAVVIVVLFFRPSGEESQLSHLTVLTTPPEALVILDGQELGLTPLRARRLPQEMQGQLVVRLDDHVTVRRTLAAGESQQIELNLERTAPEQVVVTDPQEALVTLSITSRPTGATVSLGDEVLGTTPMEHRAPRSDVPMELRFRLAGHRPASQSVSPSEDRNVRAVLTRTASRHQQEQDSLDIKLGR